MANWTARAQASASEEREKAATKPSASACAKGWTPECRPTASLRSESRRHIAALIASRSLSQRRDAASTSASRRVTVPMGSTTEATPAPRSVTSGSSHKSGLLKIRAVPLNCSSACRQEAISAPFARSESDRPDGRTSASWRMFLFAGGTILLSGEGAGLRS